MRKANDIPTLVNIYNSMTKSEKVKFRKNYIFEFDSSAQTFDRRRLSNFNDFKPSERRWAANYLHTTIENLFSLTINE